MTRVTTVRPWDDSNKRLTMDGDVVGMVRVGMMCPKGQPAYIAGYSGHAFGVRFPALAEDGRPVFFATSEEARAAVDEALRIAGVVLL